MDKKLQRIVGVLLVLAVAMVVSPLLFRKNEVSAAPTVSVVEQVASPAIAAPASSQMVAQSLAVADPSLAKASAVVPATVVAEAASSPSVPVPVAAVSSLAAEPQKSPSVPVSDDDVMISSVIDPDEDVMPQLDNGMTVLPNPQEVLGAAAAPTANSEHVTTQDNLDMINKLSESTAAKKTAVVPVVKPRSPHSKMALMHTNKKPAALGKNNLDILKKTAWAVKVGSFKSRMNAVNLTNKLRAAGYTAFIREANSKMGNLRVVYIGPESEQASAVTLAKKVQQETNIQGLIVSYKPLAL